MQRNWTRLERKQAIALLDQLGAKRDAVMFSREITEVSTRVLPFYTNYRLYKLVNYATMPVFTMQYLSDGKDFVQLDGTANPIYTVNERDTLRIDETTIIPYLDFFFAQVQGSEGDIFLIRDPKKMPIMSSLSAAQQASIVNNFAPMDVYKREDAIVLHATVYYGGGLIRSTIAVSPDGRLSFEDQSLLLSGIYFPHSPSEHAWLEG